ncbi:MAG: DASS family sodium-coupled anion symporter [Gammaproteobacteria bacterium]|nr:DASS family sodium-coupled anion symporter [Gammaproteobacteria bacterium]
MFNRTVTPAPSFWLGLAALAAALLLDPPAGWSIEAWRTAGVMVLMAVWWATEALPLPVTALAPLALLPWLGSTTAAELADGYGNPILFLILGGFLLALAMERCRLHQRIAYSIVARAGGQPRRLVLGLMTATAMVNMWVSNTSTTLMMLPVALSVVATVAPDPGAGDREQRNFATAAVLGIAYGATIGGLATLVGTPTNALVVGFMQENFGQTISFARWLVFGLPAVALLLPLAWLVLVRVAFPFRLEPQDGAGAAVRQALAELGPMTPAEKRVLAIFLLAASAWIFGPLLRSLPGLGGLSDTSVALLAGGALFLVRAGGAGRDTLLSGADLRRIPWDVLLLFGGGLALAAAIQDSGLAAIIGRSLAGLSALPLLLLMAAVVTLMIFWTELNSNVASAATFLPVLGAIAAGTHYPALTLVAPAAMAASCAFMLPVGTPPNAIVFGTGRVAIRDMIRAGWYLNLAGIVVITAVGRVVLPD